MEPVRDKPAGVAARNRRWGLVLLLIVLLGAIASPIVFQDHWWHSIGTITQSK